MSASLRVAMIKAHARNMRFRQIDQDLAEIWCEECGWLEGEPSRIAQYAKEPFRCAFCSEKAA